MGKVEEIEIMWNGQQGDEKVKIRIGAISYGDYNDAIRKSMKITMVGSQPQANIDTPTLEEHIILKSIKEAPFVVSIDNIRKLDVRDAKKIYFLASNLSGLNDIERDFLPNSPKDTQ